MIPVNLNGLPDVAIVTQNNGSPGVNVLVTEKPVPIFSARGAGTPNAQSGSSFGTCCPAFPALSKAHNMPASLRNSADQLKDQGRTRKRNSSRAEEEQNSSKQARINQEGNCSVIIRPANDRFGFKATQPFYRFSSFSSKKENLSISCFEIELPLVMCLLILRQSTVNRVMKPSKLLTKHKQVRRRRMLIGTIMMLNMILKVERRRRDRHRYEHNDQGLGNVDNGWHVTSLLFEALCSFTYEFRGVLLQLTTELQRSTFSTFWPFKIKIDTLVRWSSHFLFISHSVHKVFTSISYPFLFLSSLLVNFYIHYAGNGKGEGIFFC